MITHKDLKVWQLAINLVNEIYTLTKKFPKEELFGLTSQIRRSAVSVPSNIAEGHGRHGPRDFAQFIQIAYGSVVELDTQLIIAQNQKYITEDEYEKVADLANHVERLLNKLIISLRNKN